MYKITNLKVSVEWTVPRDDIARHCPFGKEHCFAESGEVYIPSSNSMLLQRWHPTFHNLSFFETIFGELQLTPNDVVVVNMGVHVNDKGAYNYMLENFFCACSRSQWLSSPSSVLTF